MKEMKPETKAEIISWIKTILFCIAFVVVFDLVLFFNATIPSSSMENTLYPGNRLFASRISYTLGKPDRQDIAIFYYPVDKAEGTKRYFIKRVIGLPGDTVEIRESKIYINGSTEPLDEPYLKEEWTKVNDGMTFHVPEGHYLMLGDNRNNSSDARYWAYIAYTKGLAEDYNPDSMFSFVPEEDMLAKAGFVYWPLNKIGLVK
ncbi:MAG: signal peptidase I [Clostridiales bacterium]|nr:signal peptidase I [Candidatus Blautia equi]